MRALGFALASVAGMFADGKLKMGDRSPLTSGERDKLVAFLRRSIDRRGMSAGIVLGSRWELPTTSRGKLEAKDRDARMHVESARSR